MAAKPTTKQPRERRPAISDATLQIAISAIDTEALATLKASPEASTAAAEGGAFLVIGQMYAARTELQNLLNRRAGSAPTQG